MNLNGSESLCKSCENKDIEPRLQGRTYIQKLVCIYDMSNFPNMHKCDKYQPKETEYEYKGYSN